MGCRLCARQLAAKWLCGFETVGAIHRFFPECGFVRVCVDENCLAHIRRAIGGLFESRPAHSHPIDLPRSRSPAGSPVVHRRTVVSSNAEERVEPPGETPRSLAASPEPSNSRVASGSTASDRRLAVRGPMTPKRWPVSGSRAWMDRRRSARHVSRVALLETGCGREDHIATRSAACCAESVRR